MKSHLTKLIETLENLANVVTPNEDGDMPMDGMSNEAFAGVVGYRVGRALSHARAIANKQ
jgi:hypothetical protein